ncbi:MAG TPA: hypothetical protein VL485_07655 [Ktedonobacteraceae bacterium]|jgi:hypothetical protein|nr:hypothetical protein [Ktedonobacteraceae bacterium]
MHPNIGQSVFWGAPEVIYLEGTIVSLDEQEQIAIVLIERATPHSAHLIGSNVPFAMSGLVPLVGESPPGTTTEKRAQRLPPRQMSDEEKIRSAAATAVHQQYGYRLPAIQEQELIQQISQVISSDEKMRGTIIASMNAILQREL